jgi:thymidylate synthase (FAD)
VTAQADRAVPSGTHRPIREESPVRVKLLDHTPDPIRVIWTAYRCCYSDADPAALWDEAPDREEMATFVRRYLTTSHASPRTHVSFTFAVAGVSRSCLDQIARHHVGVTFDAQSLRWVKPEILRVIEPEAIRRLKYRPESSAERVAYDAWLDAGKAACHVYHALLDAGVPAEDARYCLPLGIETSFVVTANLQALLHIGDERLCMAAQWEIRHLVARMRAELMRVVPELAEAIQPKCGAWRLGYCNEPLSRWRACPIGKVRPHRSQLTFRLPVGSERHRDLSADDYRVIEES